MKTGGRISARSIFRWLAGESEPYISVLRLLCPALDVTADWLCALDDQELAFAPLGATA